MYGRTADYAERVLSPGLSWNLCLKELRRRNSSTLYVSTELRWEGGGGGSVVVTCLL